MMMMKTKPGRIKDDDYANYCHIIENPDESMDNNDDQQEESPITMTTEAMKRGFCSMQARLISSW